MFTNLWSLITASVISQLGWVLVHSLWQFIAIALS